ncbi:MAG: hypothetical protein BWK73_04580 [Thiothrix lacustris]|uniref:Uncharacterized protein n=1 Tax=Thiothrix lacustris TaxID=525917 RepID=A0A1Y1QY26_9GAMM|nr:MAG: hypothetical protein BWK73_04580 [Thiothrix lacustris]
MNRAVFFDQIRPMFPGGLRQYQVERIEAILDAWEATDHTDNRWLAYALGTAHHESMWEGIPFEAYREQGGTAYFTRLYDITQNPRKAKDLGNTQPGDGAKFHGRGPDMITGRRNYANESKRCGVDLVAHPEKAEEPRMAAERLIRNMVAGAYRKHKLADFFIGNVARWVDARNIINHPSSKPHEVAEFAKRYYKAIELAQVITPPVDLAPAEQYSLVTTEQGETLGMIESSDVPAPQQEVTVKPVTQRKTITHDAVLNNPLMAIFLKIIPPGYGTYVTLIVWIGLNVASAFGVEIPLFDAMSGNETIGGVLGFVLMRLRFAMK